VPEIRQRTRERSGSLGNSARHPDCAVRPRMLDRQKIEAILSRRFPGATHPQIAAAANAIMGMDDEWEELPGHQIGDATREVDRGAELRFFRRRESST